MFCYDISMQLSTSLEFIILNDLYELPLQNHQTSGTLSKMYPNTLRFAKISSPMNLLRYLTEIKEILRFSQIDWNSEDVVSNIIKLN